MAYELDHCYRLLPGHYYWIPDLQESVAFKDPVAVKIKNFHQGQPVFGNLIRLGKGTRKTDIETDVTVEIGKNCLGEEIYLKDSSKGFSPIFYIEF